MTDTAQPRLTVVPVRLRQARQFVAEHHRTHPGTTGGLWATGVCDQDGQLRGVAIIGRPNARADDNGLTAEVVRSATDGCPNANSALYGAAWRQACAHGYRRLITYNQDGETGVSLQAAGWRRVRELPPRKGWAASSVAMRALRDPVGAGGVARTLWEAS
jgi:hypothetical protein